MSPSAEQVPVVALVDVTDQVLERLLGVALHDADADEVTPPLGTGLWLGRSFRGRGIGGEALRLVKAEAAAAGADLLEAETTPGNAAAQALLRAAGAALAVDGQRVKARVKLG